MNTNLQLRRIALLSSGVGYFEHSGNIAGSASITLPFDAGAVNDALKSLVINDPASSSPSVRYAAENTLALTLRSLKVDLSGDPGIAEILSGVKGAELEVSAPNAITGKILGVEYRDIGVSPAGGPVEGAWLSLFTPQGIRAVAIKDISSFRFTDESINADLSRALELILTSRDTDTRDLLVTLNGEGSRGVSLSYVIPSPVWKVSYRLDLSTREAPFLQGWAIVDNDSDTDWKEVELSLLTGRPVSFIQNLYPPLRLSRPVLPLSIAGIAESRTYDSGYGGGNQALRRESPKMAAMEMAEEMDAMYETEASASYAPAPAQAVPPRAVAGGVVQTAAAGAAGDQFEFTLKNPVTLERRQSAMLPLVEGQVKAEKLLVFSGSRAAAGVTIHPGISAELVNTSGMKLPAGPVTVYDGGAYAGDALIGFFPEDETRLISYGEDLSVTGSLTASGTRYVTGVSIANGVMTINRRQTYEKVYTLRNASVEAKKIIIEHPVTFGAELAEPESAEDRTASLYRFRRNLAAKETLDFKVREESPLSERIVLSQLRPEAFLAYSANGEIPADARAALSRAIELKKKADDAAAAQKELESQRQGFVTDQDRVRRNLEAAGNQSPQGQEYLKRLADLDNSIDTLTGRINTAAKEAENARKAYADYLAAIKL